MKSFNETWRTVILAVMAASVVGCGPHGGALATESPSATASASPVPTLAPKNVPDKVLRAWNISFTSPSPAEVATARISRDEAETASGAMKLNPAATVQEVFLADLHRYSDAGGEGKLVWVVNYYSEKPFRSGSGLAEEQYLVVLVDPATGEPEQGLVG